jgi:hypothetical protein
VSSERGDGPTPNGGAYSIASFFDADGQPCAKDDAVTVVIGEYDSADKMICETVGSVTRGVSARPRRRPRV